MLRPRADDYRGATPRPSDVLLVVEVADTSLAYDRAVKLALYARHGISEAWIVNVAPAEAEVWRTPAGDRYANCSRVVAGGVLEPASLPGVSVAATGVLG